MTLTRLTRLLCTAALGALTVGCGARTGLPAPDIGLDAGVDMAMDMAVDAEVPCLEIPFDAGIVEVELETEARVGRADVVFLIDRTLSMSEEISRIRDRLRDRIAPAIRAAIPDSQLAVASFADFPVADYGSQADGDTPFTLHLSSSAAVESAQGAVDSIRLSNGLDRRESQVEALYQVATGAGIGSFVPPSVGCPSGGVGYACLRTDALPVIMLFTDAQFHNDPFEAGSEYVGVFPAPHTWDETLAELDRIGARVLGFDSGGGTAAPPLRRLATMTGAVDDRGAPLVFDIGTVGERLSTGVVDAIRTFASTAIQDISVIAQDPDRNDGVDVLQFVDGIIPVRAVPMDGISGRDIPGQAFLGVRAGTLLVFSVALRNGVVAPGVGPQRFRLELLFVGDGRAFIDRQIVEIVIPGADGSGCDDLPMMLTPAP
ncbi:MAG: hypothetical protein H6725_07120 [Sandaracinaceae bacterium]|nr:hypothetical protein [Sandaracinaceae bacterium]